MASKPSRISSIDALRGLIMITMALDHANYFVAHKHPQGEHWGGNFPVYQDGFAFVTRLVTHLSAPGFFFLMGVGMYLFTRSRRSGGWREWAIVGHFLIRGVILIMVQLLIVNRAWQLGPDVFPEIYIGVLIALGGTMILASFLLRFHPIWWLVGALISFLGMELLHPHPDQWGLSEPLGLLFLYSGGDLNLWSNYPILPWMELVLLGMFVGYWIGERRQQATRDLSWVGILCLLGFITIRTLDGFGNIRPMQGDDWIAFLNVVKYPPSMSFTLLTLCINLVILGGFSLAEENHPKLLVPFQVFGRVPFFFYILHLYLYLGLGVWLTPQGTSLMVMYVYWLLGLVVLFPLCMYYGRYKKQQSPSSILRFF